MKDLEAKGLKSIWLLKEPTVPLLIHLLPTLRSLRLTSSARILEWEAMPWPLQASFIHLFTLPSLTKIQLLNVRLPVGVLAQSTQLTELSVRRSQFYRTIGIKSLSTTFPSTPKPPTPNLERPRLGTLSITSEMAETFIEDLTSVLDVSHLHKLVLFDPDGVTFEAVAAIIKLSAASLEWFEWEIPGWIGSGDHSGMIILFTFIKPHGYA